MYNPDEECRKIIQKIQKLCEIKGMSQYAVAVKAEISTSTMHNLMAGKSNPYIYTLYKICNTLNVPLEILFCDELLHVGDDQMEELFAENLPKQNTSKILSDEEREILLTYRCFSEKKKEIFKLFVDILQQYENEEMRR